MGIFVEISKNIKESNEKIVENYKLVLKLGV